MSKFHYFLLQLVIEDSAVELQSFNANQEPEHAEQNVRGALDGGQSNQQNTGVAGPSSSDVLFTSPFLHQDYSSMLGHSNPMLMRQSLGAAHHAPQLPITNNQLQQVKVNPQKQSYSSRTPKRVFPGSRGVSPYEKRSFSFKNALDVTDTDRKKRFNRTRDALESSGLMGITMKTADLLKKNESLEKEILKLKRETESLLKAILLNPGNEHLKHKFSSSASIKR